MRRGSDNPSIWAGAVMQELSINAKNANGDRLTDQQTDGLTDIVGYRVACLQQEIHFSFMFNHQQTYSASQIDLSNNLTGVPQILEQDHKNFILFNVFHRLLC